MIKGFIIGKFMPFHKGHEALIEYAKSNCDHLTILVGFREGEPIPLKYRLHWVTSTYLHDPKIQVIGDTINHQTDLSFEDLSAWWGKHILENFGQFTRVFSSEDYGKYFAKCMNAENWVFNEARTIVPISGTLIRQKPHTHWEYLNNFAKDYYVKKIAIVGTESTGKTTMCDRLAKHYNTVWCPELGRELVPDTNECTFSDLNLVAAEHARYILKHTRMAKKVLFVDTDIIITRSYARHLFNRELKVPLWVDEANEMDDYIFLASNAPWIDDGTRMPKEKRDELAQIHRKGFEDANIKPAFFDYPQGFEYQGRYNAYDHRLEEVIKHIDEFLTKF